jgi:hypothetical protein
LGYKIEDKEEDQNIDILAALFLAWLSSLSTWIRGSDVLEDMESTDRWWKARAPAQRHSSCLDTHVQDFFVNVKLSERRDEEIGSALAQYSSLCPASELSVSHAKS